MKENTHRKYNETITLPTNTYHVDLTESLIRFVDHALKINLIGGTTAVARPFKFIGITTTTWAMITTTPFDGTIITYSS